MPGKPIASNSTDALPELLIQRYTPTASRHTPPPYTLNQHSQHPSYRPNSNRHDTMGYRYPQDFIYTNPSRKPPLPSADRTDKYRRRSTIIVT